MGVTVDGPGDAGARQDAKPEVCRQSTLRAPSMKTPRASSALIGPLLSLALGGLAGAADEADLILHHGKVVTANRDFSVRHALAVKGGRPGPARINR